MSSWTLYPGRGRVADAAAPDVRGRSYAVVVRARLVAGDAGVLIAHGDRHAGYALRIDSGHLVHHYAHAGVRTTTRSAGPVPTGAWVDLAARVDRTGNSGRLSLLVNGAVVARSQLPGLARARTGYTGVDIGCDRGLTVGDYRGPARFTGQLLRVDVNADDDQCLDLDALWEIEGATG